MCDACCTASRKQAQRPPGCVGELHLRVRLSVICTVCQQAAASSCKRLHSQNAVARHQAVSANELAAFCPFWSNSGNGAGMYPLSPLRTRVLASVATMRQARLVLPQAPAAKSEHHLNLGPAAMEGVDSTVGTGNDCICLNWGTHLCPDLVLLFKLLQLFLLLLQLLFKVLH